MDANESEYLTFMLEDSYGQLASGDYRIVKPFTRGQWKDGHYEEEYWLGVDFTPE